MKRTLLTLLAGRGIIAAGAVQTSVRHLRSDEKQAPYPRLDSRLLTRAAQLARVFITFECRQLRCTSQTPGQAADRRWLF